MPPPSYQCSCPRCTDITVAGEIRKESNLKRLGWHFIACTHDYACPNHYNFRTYGLRGNFNHPNLQICFPMDILVVYNIFSRCVWQIKGGKPFVTGVRYPDILLGGYSAVFIDASERGGKVLRLLIPDIRNDYETPMYAQQFLSNPTKIII